MKSIELFQWDLNRSIEVPSGSKAHFASVGSLQALVVMEQGGKASVPNILLQEPKDINVWIVRDGATTDSGKIRITSRPVPSDYVYTETDVETVETLTQAMVAAIESEIAHAEAQIAAAKAQADEATQTANQAITKAQETHKIAEADIAENRQLRETLKAEEAKRATAETNRKAEETKRVEAEAARKSAETTRAANETKRTETFNSNLVSWNTNVDTTCKKATDTANKAAQDAKTATDAAIAKTEQATNAAVAKAQTATDNATTAANKAETVVAQLPLPLGNTLKGEVESTMVNVHDAFPAPLVETKVMGQSNQITTTGKNLMRLINSSTANGVNLTANGDGSYHVKGTQTVGYTRFYTDDGIKKPLAEFGLKVGDTVYLSAAEASTKLYITLFFWDEKGSNVYTQVTTSANVAKYTIPENVTQAYACISLDGNVGTSVDSDFHPMISLSNNKDWEPYTGGKPSPSPEYPQEITNLNKAELVITGRNIVKQSTTSVNAINRYSSCLFIEADLMPSTNYVLSFNDVVGNRYYINEGLFENFHAFTTKSGRNVVKLSTKANISKTNIAQYVSQGWIILKNDKNQDKAPDFKDVQLEYGSTATAYEPYISKSTPIDLKGNELCSLPDGIKDEVVIDSEGNVSLIKRVAKVNLESLVSERIQRQSNGKWLTYISVPQIKGNFNKDCATCNKYLHVGDLQTAAIHGNIFVGANSLICLGIPENLYPKVDVEAAEATPEIKAWFNEIKVGTVVYGMATNPQTIPLGKVELPALPESTSNIWNNGNIPANVYIQYLKDVNIAYTDLENQIKQITAALSMIDTPTIIPEMAWGTPAAL